MRSNFAPRPHATGVQATVKWFNPTKGFGFVSPSDGSPDAFLHISVVEAAGRASMPEGATIVCDLAQGQKGPQVSAIHSVDESTATPRQSDRGAGGYGGGGYGGGGYGRGGGGGSGGGYSSGATEIVEGTVKFFNPEKGFGFVTPDGGGKDVFVHIRALERSGLMSLDPDQRVRLTTSMGQKGPQADRIEII